MAHGESLPAGTLAHSTTLWPAFTELTTSPCCPLNGELVSRVPARAHTLMSPAAAASRPGASAHGAHTSGLGLHRISKINK